MFMYVNVGGKAMTMGTREICHCFHVHSNFVFAFMLLVTMPPLSVDTQSYAEAC